MGLVEIGDNVEELTIKCPTCDGKGRIKEAESYCGSRWRIRDKEELSFVHETHGKIIGDNDDLECLAKGEHNIHYDYTCKPCVECWGVNIHTNECSLRDTTDPYSTHYYWNNDGELWVEVR